MRLPEPLFSRPALPAVLPSLILPCALNPPRPEILPKFPR